MTVNDIYEFARSWINTTLNNWKPEAKQLAQERLKICLGLNPDGTISPCPYAAIGNQKALEVLDKSHLPSNISNIRCSQCGCLFVNKLPNETQSCPLNPPKWDKIK